MIEFIFENVVDFFQFFMDFPLLFPLQKSFQMRCQMSGKRSKYTQTIDVKHQWTLGVSLMASVEKSFEQIECQK